MAISVDTVRAVATPIAGAAGLDVEDIIITTVGRREKVVVIIDGDGGVSLDAIADMSTSLSAELDAREDLASSPYVLEVTSPGVDRPLTEPRHWRRAKDRLVKIETSDGANVTGRIVDSDDSHANVDVAGEIVSVPLADVSRAIVQVEFDRKDA